MEGLPVSITLFIYLSGGVLPISFHFLVSSRPSVGCLFVLVFFPVLFVWRNEIIRTFFSFFFLSVC